MPSFSQEVSTRKYVGFCSALKGFQVLPTSGGYQEFSSVLYSQILAEANWNGHLVDPEFGPFAI